MEHKLTVRRAKHFIGGALPCTLTIEDDGGLRSLTICSGQTAETTVYGSAVIHVSADTRTGFVKSEDETVEDGEDAVYKLETGYSIYTGTLLALRKVKT